MEWALLGVIGAVMVLSLVSSTGSGEFVVLKRADPSPAEPHRLAACKATPAKRTRKLKQREGTE
jgi:hypothetical protein